MNGSVKKKKKKKPEKDGRVNEPRARFLSYVGKSENLFSNFHPDRF